MDTNESFSQEVLHELEKPLDASLIHHRNGHNGKKLAYLKGSTAIEHANCIFGYGKWGYRLLRQQVHKAYGPEDVITGLYYETDIELYVWGALFSFPGCGAAAVEKPYGPVQYENARKASVKDAVKLALVNYGSQFGLPLYDADALVEAEDGHLVAVKDVPTKRNTPAPVHTVEEVKACFLKVYRDGNKWEAFKTHVLARSIGDEHLSDGDLARLNGRIEQAVREVKQRKALKGNS